MKSLGLGRPHTWAKVQKWTPVTKDSRGLKKAVSMRLWRWTFRSGKGRKGGTIHQWVVVPPHPPWMVPLTEWYHPEWVGWNYLLFRTLDPAAPEPLVIGIWNVPSLFISSLEWVRVNRVRTLSIVGWRPENIMIIHPLMFSRMKATKHGAQDQWHG